MFVVVYTVVVYARTIAIVADTMVVFAAIAVRIMIVVGCSDVFVGDVTVGIVVVYVD